MRSLAPVLASLILVPAGVVLVAKSLGPAPAQPASTAPASLKSPEARPDSVAITREQQAAALDLLVQAQKVGIVREIDFSSSTVYCDVGFAWGSMAYRERQGLCRALLAGYPGHRMAVIRDYRDHQRLMEWVP